MAFGALDDASPPPADRDIMVPTTKIVEAGMKSNLANDLTATRRISVDRSRTIAFIGESRVMTGGGTIEPAP